MSGIASRPSASALYVAAGASAVVAVFLRGNYLLGFGCGAVYVVIALAILWLLARSRTPTGGVSVMRAGFVVAFALPVGYAMAFPASINPDVQLFIDDQATDRRVRAQLAAVFASDPVYHDLSVSSVHRKGIIITVRGSLRTRTDLEQLRSRLAEECPTFCECSLHWDVYLRDAEEPVSVPDRDLLQNAEPDAAPDPADE